MDQARSGALKCKVMQNLSGSEHPHKTGSHIPASVTSGSKVGLGAGVFTNQEPLAVNQCVGFSWVLTINPLFTQASWNGLLCPATLRQG